MARPDVSAVAPAQDGYPVVPLEEGGWPWGSGDRWQGVACSPGGVSAEFPAPWSTWGVAHVRQHSSHVCEEPLSASSKESIMLCGQTPRGPPESKGLHRQPPPWGRQGGADHPQHERAALSTRQPRVGMHAAASAATAAHPTRRVLAWHLVLLLL